MALGVPTAYSLWKKIGGSKQSAHDLWSGKVVMIRLETIDALCELLRCEPTDLFEKVPTDWQFGDTPDIPARQ